MIVYKPSEVSNKVQNIDSDNFELRSLSGICDRDWFYN